MNLKDNSARVQERIHAACQRSGRRREEVRMLAVSKTVSADLIREAYECGLKEFGENRVQEAAAKRPALSGLDVMWHLIGHLQTNKARLARELFNWFHAVDSLRVAQKLDQVAGAESQKFPVLMEVNLGAEESKFGVREQVAPLAEQIAQLKTIDLRGLMVIPLFTENPEDARPYFRRLRELALQIEAQKIPGVSMRELSMGMSHDFEVAIEEGATIVRIGAAIFGARS